MSEYPCTKMRQNLEMASKVFNVYGDEIRAMIQFNLKNDNETDDIYQEFFLSVVRKPIPQNVQDVRGYLYKAITHDIIDVSRRNKSLRDRVHKYAEHRKYDLVEEDPQEIVVQAEKIQNIFGAIERRLPKREAEAVLQRYSNDLDNKEAAVRMSIKRRSVSRYLSLAIKKMREFVHKDMDGDDCL